MKIIRTIREEIVPLSKQQGVILLVIIACIFQFVLFYAPALADDAVKQAKAQTNEEDMLVFNEVMIKDSITNTATKSQEASSTPVVITVPESTPASSTPEYKIVRTSTHTMTAYNSEPGQTDDSPCITANGFNVCKHGEEDTIAANFLKFGTKVMIPELFGDRVFTVRDRMNQKHPNRVDVWMKDHSNAMKFGVKVAKIQVIEYN
ncbi:MAG: hypothetical protein WCT50_02250 [Patescibacteria group bacterium]